MSCTHNCNQGRRCRCCRAQKPSALMPPREPAQIPTWAGLGLIAICSTLGLVVAIYGR